MNLPIIPTIKSITDLRYQTADIIRLLGQNQPVVVTRDNDTVAVMLSPAHYQQVLAQFEELEDLRDAKRLDEAIQKGGTFIPFDTFHKKQKRKLGIT